MSVVHTFVLLSLVLIKVNTLSEENQEKLILFAQEKYSLWLHCRNAVKIIKSAVESKVCDLQCSRFKACLATHFDRLCGLVVGVSGYRYRGPGFDPRRYQIF